MSTEKRTGTSYAEMFWWASGEVEHLKAMEEHFPASQGRANAIRRSEATLRLIAWCWDHAAEIKEIAARDARDKARKARTSPARSSPKAGNADSEGTSSTAA